MSQHLTLVYSNSKPVSRRTKLDSVRCRMLPADSPSLPPVAAKAARLQQQQPDVASVIEQLIDDLLVEVS